MLSRTIYILAALSLLLISCSKGEENGEAGDEGNAGRRDAPLRLHLLNAATSDSAAPATPVIVDQALRRAFDSTTGVEYLTLNYRDSIRLDSTTGDAAIRELASKLKLDGLVTVRTARFGSVVGVSMDVVDPSTGKPLFGDRAFSFMRYRRAEDDAPLMGPALYEAIERLAFRFMKRPETGDRIVSAEPLIVYAVAIPNDTALGRIASSRQKIAGDAVKALGDMARLHFPAYVTFDYESRSRLNEQFGVKLVADYEPITDVERTALFQLDVPRYMTGGVSPRGDSVEIRTEIRYVVSPRLDSLVDSESKVFSKREFATSTMIEDVVVAILDLAEPLLKRDAERIRAEYKAEIAAD